MIYIRTIKVVTACFILIATQQSVTGQLRKIVFPANVQTESDYYSDDRGTKYSQLITVGFREEVVGLTKGKTQARLSDMKPTFSQVVSAFNSLSQRYGEIVIDKKYPEATWGNIWSNHIITGEPVKLREKSQIFKFRFTQPIPLDSVAGVLKSLPEVEFVDLPQQIYLLDTPNDYYYSSTQQYCTTPGGCWNVGADYPLYRVDSTVRYQWYLDKLQAQKAWGITKGKSDIVVGINDDWEGSSSPHEDLVGKYVSELDFSWGWFGGHGENVASCVTANTNNSLGLAGLGWNIRLGKSWLGSGGLNAMVTSTNPPKVINMSWKSGGYATDDRATILDGLRRGIVFVAAAGNDGSPEPIYPAAYYFAGSDFSDGIAKQVIAVAATDIGDWYHPGWVSSPGTNPTSDPTNAFIDVGAPGHVIFSAIQTSAQTEKYRHVNGTSNAAPMVSALIALVLSINSSLKPHQIYDIITKSADKVGQSSYPYSGPSGSWNQHLGYGRINAYKALKYTLENYGGTLTQSITIPSGESWNFGAVSIKLAPNINITVQQGGSMTANGTRFEPQTPGQRWGTVYLYGNNNSFYNCIFDGGAGNVPVSATQMVYVASTGNTFSGCTFRNSIDRCITGDFTPQGTRSAFNLFNCTFENSYVGMINLNANTYYIDNCTFQNNDNTAIFNFGNATISEMGYTKIINNSRIVGDAAVINYGTMGMIAYSNNGYNVVKNNRGVELYNAGYLNVSVPWAQANSTIRDDINGFAYSYIRNQNGYFTVPARGVWWGGTPQAGMFEGPVDYSNPLSSNPTGYSASPDGNLTMSSITLPNASVASSAGFSTPSPNADARATRNAWLKQRMTQLRDELRKNPDDEQSARKLTELYGWMSYDRQNETDERAATLPIFTEFESNLKVARSGNRRASSATQASGETAMCAISNWLIETERYDEARAQLRETEPFIDSKENQLTLRLRKATLHEQARRYALALSALEQAKAISKELYPKESNRLDIWESTLKWKMTNDTTAVGSSADEAVPNIALNSSNSDNAKLESFGLSQNYPNPFNPSTVISYQLPTSSQVSLKIYDMLGREVQTLVNETQAAGRYAVRFNAANLASGTYFYKLQTNRFVQTRKLTLLK